jgi:hypothetical protein
MCPNAPDDAPDLFRAELRQILDLSHPLCRLAEKIDWSVFEEAFGPLYSVETGRPALPIRLMVGLHYLKHAFDESDESVVPAGWRTPTGSTSAATRTSSRRYPWIAPHW